MHICGREFSDATLEWIREQIRQEPTISRRSLSRRMCTLLNWRSPNGRLQEVSCRKALVELHRRGYIKLADTSMEWAFQRRGQGRERQLSPPLNEVECRLEDLGRVEVRLITSRYSQASHVWNALLEHHYLGPGPLCGAQLRYLIWCERYGYLGGLAFSAPAWQVRARDQYIGWNKSAQRHNLHRLVNNSRFLILPTVRVPNLATHVLSACSKRLAEDWERRYSYQPVLLETFVEHERFSGTCYRAANWPHVGMTVGRGRQNKARPCKDIYVYGLCPNWQIILCTDPDGKISVVTPEPVREPADWTEEEFSMSDLGDERLVARLVHVTAGLYGKPGASISHAMTSPAAAKAAYRFFDNPKIDLDSILQSHYEASGIRMGEHATVLAVQDTTSLNYTAHPATQGMGPINTKKDAGVGLLLHSTMAFTPEGTPLGLLDVQCWARDPEQAGQSEKRHGISIEAKESFKWLKSYEHLCELQKRRPKTRLISISDRESDIYDLFVEVRKEPGRPDVVVRADSSRKRKVDEDNLWDRLAREPLAGMLEVNVPQREKRPPRKAKMEIRWSQVELTPPQRKLDLPSVRVFAVYLRERQTPAEATPLEWMLTTSVTIADFEGAVQVVQWYIRRWGIEVFHRVLKSGCRIEDRRLGTAQRIENCLAVDLVVAWRIHHLTFLGRETPDLPCTVFFEDMQWKALVAFVNKNPIPPSTPPTLREATRLVARLGGFLGRKSDGQPGTQTVWRGLQRLDDITESYKAFGPPALSHHYPGRHPP